MATNNTIPPKANFPKAEKLKSRKAIDSLFKSGKSFFIHPYKVFYQVEVVVDSQLSIVNSQSEVIDIESIEQSVVEQSTSLQIAEGPKLIADSSKPKVASAQVGFAVSTKIFKHAVDRNRVKRLGREAYRLNKYLLIPNLEKQHVKLQIFFVFTNKTLPTFVNLQAAMQACLRKLVKSINRPKNEGLL